MLEDLTADQASLANLMSEISERCHCAGWMRDLEFTLWAALLNGPREYGLRNITAADIEGLKTLSDKAKCWIFFDDIKEETAIGLTEWQNRYEAEIDRGSKYP